MGLIFGLPLLQSQRLGFLRCKYEGRLRIDDLNHPSVNQPKPQRLKPHLWNLNAVQKVFCCKPHEITGYLLRHLRGQPGGLLLIEGKMVSK